MKTAIIILLILALLPAAAVVAENSVKLDQIIQNGVTIGGGKLVAGLPAQFNFRLTNNSGIGLKGISLDIGLYTYRSGVYTKQYDQLRVSELVPLGTFFDMDFTRPCTWDSIGTCFKIDAWCLSSFGMPGIYSEQIVAAHTGNFVAGDTVAIVKSWDTYYHWWYWSTDTGDIIPDWPGPYNFPVVNCCAYAGDCDFNGKITVADLTTLVQYIFPPHTPILCNDAANVNGSTGTTPVNVADVTYLVNHLFKGGAPPVACQ